MLFMQERQLAYKPQPALSSKISQLFSKVLGVAVLFPAIKQ